MVRMRILFLSMEYPPETGWGGIGSYVASVAPALAARGHEVHVLSCVRRQKFRDYIDRGVYIHRRGQFRIWGRRYFPLTVDRLRVSLSAFFWYRHLRRSGMKFDIIEYPDWAAEGLFFALVHSKPIVAHLHTPLPVISRYNGLSANTDNRWASALERFSVHRADLVTSPSKLLVKELKGLGWLQNQRVEVIPYCIDWTNWQGVQSVLMTEPTLLFVGRLERIKAPEVLVEAVAILQKEMPGIRTIFIGRSGVRDGLAYREWLERKYAGSVKGCEFTDYLPRSELPAWMARARVVVVPSWFDNFPMVVLEAMASGRPVCVTETTGSADWVKGHNLGAVVPPGDPEALADALRPFLKDPVYAAEVGERARNFVREYFDPHRIAEAREAIYQKAIDCHIVRRKEQLRKQSFGFPYACAERVGNLCLPQPWRDLVATEAAEEPWRHFYLRTGEALLQLLVQHPQFAAVDSLSGTRVLDIGCTPALDALLACLGAEVVLLDLDWKELEKGRMYACLLGVEDRIRYVQADAFAIPFSPGSFDLVWNSGFIEHFDDPVSIVRDMARLTRPGGAVIVLVPNRWTPHSLWIREHLRRKPKGYYWDFMGRERSYSKKELEGILKAAGLSVIASFTTNLRRSFLDDFTVLPRLKRLLPRRILYAIINFTDWMEKTLPFLRELGFMVGAIGTPNRISVSSEFPKGSTERP